MSRTLSNQRHRRNAQEKTVNVIIGCQRLRCTSWSDALAIVRNGAGYIRHGNTLTWFFSEAYEQGQVS